MRRERPVLIWVNKRMKKSIRRTALDLDKNVIDLEPEDILKEIEGNDERTRKRFKMF